MRGAFRVALLVVVLAAMYLVLQVGFVRPHFWPAGHGARVAGDSRFTGGSATQTLLLGRPPVVSARPEDASTIRDVVPGSPADRAGLRPGDRILSQRRVTTGQTVDTRRIGRAGAAEQMRIWRDAYRMGVRDPLELTIAGPGERSVTVARPAAWEIGGDVFSAWTKQHISGLLQMVVFITISATLLALRASDATAVLAVLALTLCAVTAGGPPMGEEFRLPTPLGPLMVGFTWLATPLGFIGIAFVILYFPRKADILTRLPWLRAVPFVVTAPMLILAGAAALFLIGFDGLVPIVAWDATHPWAYFGSFAVGVAMNVAIVIEGMLRYRRNPDQNERRRIKIAMITIVPGVLAYAVKDGLPGLALVTGQALDLPWWMTLALQLVVLLPAFGITYAVTVHRVFAPATVLRRSLQYALARRTLTVLAMLPAVALVASLVRNRDMSIAMLVSGRPLFYVLTTAGLVLTLRYRNRARAWLDRQFFREAYDAREILLSLASRITYETDPDDLTAMVVDRIDTALHPETVAVFVAGVNEGMLTPVAVMAARKGPSSVPPLPSASGVVTLLQWSNEPLELYLDDERSPARRLPSSDQAWLAESRSVLLVPVSSRGRLRAVGASASLAEARQSDQRAEAGNDDGPRASLVGFLALGARRSDEPYTAEDRQLLASIAAQMALALDVARLRRRLEGAAPAEAAAAAPTMAGLAECPQCGRCTAPDLSSCPNDGTAMHLVSTVPHVVERKYRIDQLIGRGGMGAVYRARDVRLDRDVALKVVRADLLNDPDSRMRFRREAQIVARLQHPGIVSVFDYGTFPDGSAFLVMELIRGDDLRRALRRDGPMPVSRAVPLVSAICGAVHAAHRQGVLHRDLKPENILLVDGDPPVKVLDFGVAKLVADRTSEETGLKTLTGVIVGTPAYMAPEQLRGEQVDARTDVFSLGVIAYELLTGDLPFGRASLWELGIQQAHGMKPMAPAGESIARHVQEAIRSALSVEPAARPASAIEFAQMMTGREARIEP